VSGAIREIIAHFGVEFDDKGIKKGHEHVEGLIHKLKEFGEAAIAAFAVEKIYEFLNGITEQAKGLKEHAAVLGMSLAALQEWNYAAKVSGVSAQALSMSLGRLSAGKYDKKAFKELGITAHGGAEIFEQLADKLVAIEDPAKRNALAMKVLGRSYRSLMPLLLEGGEGIRELREEFKHMGGGFSEDFAKTSTEIQHNTQRLHARWEMFKIFLASKLLPTMLTVSKKFVEWLPKILELAKNSNILQVATAALAVGGLMKLSAALGPLTGKLLGLGKAIAWLLIFEDIVTFFRGGDSVTGDILSKMFPQESVERLRHDIPALWGDVFGTGMTGAFAAIIAGFEILYNEFINGTRVQLGQLLDLYNAAANMVGEKTGGRTDRTTNNEAIAQARYDKEKARIVTEAAQAKLD